MATFHKDLTGADLHESKIPVVDSAEIEKAASPGKALKEGQNINLTVSPSSKSIEIALSKPLPSGDVVGTSDTQILTNKTITDSTNDVSANNLKTSGADVVIDVAAPPTPGQVLTASTPTTAVWSNVAGGTGHAIQDEGTPALGFPARTFLNFVGNGITVTDDLPNNATVVTVSQINPTWVEDIFTGTGAQTLFTLSFLPLQNPGVFVFVNGLARTSGGGNDYTISGTSLTFNFTPGSGDKILVKYEK